MAGTEKIMDHSEYPKSLRNKQEVSLRYIMRDCRAVVDAWRAYGEYHPNEGYYLDEISYGGAELTRRAKKGQKR